MVRLIRDFAVVLLGAWTIFATLVRRLVRGPKHPDWSLGYEVVTEVMRAVLRAGHAYMSVALQRQQPSLPLPARIKRKLDWGQDTMAGIQVETHTPRDWEPGAPTWLHFHGGAYTMCSPATHREMLARIALASSARCIAPDYRKAPEHPYPAAIDDCFAVYQEVLAGGVDPDTLVVGGDSAGGGLALAVMQRVRAAGLPMPKASVLLSPWVDLTATSGGSVDDNAPYDYLRGDMLEWAASVYLDGADPRGPEVSPVYADLAGMPPMLVQSGGGELFLDQHRQFVQRAHDAGVDVIHEVTDGMVHVFQMLGQFRQAREAVRSIGQYVRSTVGRAVPDDTAA